MKKCLVKFKNGSTEPLQNLVNIDAPILPLSLNSCSRSTVYILYYVIIANSTTTSTKFYYLSHTSSSSMILTKT